MKINGWDIENARAKQWNVTFANHSVSNESEWTRGSPIPAFLKNTIGFKPLKVALLVKGDGREEILGKVSEILARLLDSTELELDGYSHRFKGILSKHSLEENPLNIRNVFENRASKLILEFNCYEYAVDENGSAYEVSASGREQITVVNQGNLITPVVVEITPQIGVATLKLTGICRDPVTGEDLPVTVRNLVTGKKVILDGESGLMTEDGKLKAEDIDIWDIPTLLPGENTITLDSDRMNATVKYYPRYM